MNTMSLVGAVMLVLPVGASAQNAAGAAWDAPVPAAVQQWFTDEQNVDDFLLDKDDLHELSEDSPAVADALSDGARPSFGRVVQAYRITTPSMDLRTTTLSDGPTTLPEVLVASGRYCSMVHVQDLRTDSVLCVQQDPDGTVSMTDQGYSMKILDTVDDLPANGYVDMASELFSFDVERQTLTAMDEAALQDVPQGTVGVREMVTALARAEAERTLIDQKGTQPGGGGGGDLPLFGGSPSARAEHEAYVASLLDQSADGGDAEPSPSPSAAISSDDPGTGPSSTALVGLGAAVVLVASGAIVAVRRRRSTTKRR